MQIFLYNTVSYIIFLSLRCAFALEDCLFLFEIIDVYYLQLLCKYCQISTVLTSIIVVRHQINFLRTILFHFLNSSIVSHKNGNLSFKIKKLRFMYILFIFCSFPGNLYFFTYDN